MFHAAANLAGALILGLPRSRASTAILCNQNQLSQVGAPNEYSKKHLFLGGGNSHLSIWTQSTHLKRVSGPAAAP
eukprot:973702-Pelagomonas_calceolata.AAC.1